MWSHPSIINRLWLCEVMAESQQMITPAAELITKPGTNAPLWEYFGSEKDKNGAVIYDSCVVC